MSTRDLKTSPFASLLASLGLVALCACQPTEPSPTDSFAPSPSPVPTEPSPLNVAPPIQQQCHGVELNPGVDLVAKVTGNPEGTTFCLDPGVYRISVPLVLRAGQELIGTGNGDAVISGAKVVTASKQGSYWVITGQTSLGTSGVSPLTDCVPVDGKDPGAMCIYVDQAFLNGRSLWQVGSLGELSSGEFFWDYAANKIYLADDPTGKKLELSVATAGISGGPDVALRNLVVEKFGNPVQGGAISTSSGYWLLQGVESRFNHGGGIHMGPYTIVRDSYIHHNGQLGIHGGQPMCAGAKGLVLKDSELSYNNAAGYNYSWEAGATKWTNTDGLIARGNDIHDNYGSGLWTDGPNIRTLFEENIIEDNYASGIVHELGYQAVIRHNVVRRTGLQHPVPDNVWGAGILIDQSRDVEVYGNIVTNNGAGITAVQEPAWDECGMGEQEVANLHVHDNTVRQASGIAAGLNLYLENDQSYYQNKNNRWERNVYHLGDRRGLSFYWAGHAVAGSQWRSLGQDAEGSFLDLTKVSSPDAPWPSP